MSAQLPCGWRQDPADPARMLKDPQEQSVIRKIARFNSEGLGYREIARRLDQDGYDCRGGVWYHTTIKGILTRAQAG